MLEAASSLLKIILLNLALSGDNVVVIGLAVHRLPPAERRRALVIGGGGAIVMRIVLTTVAAEALGVPGLRALGGCLLLWIAFRLLKEEEEQAEGVRVATTTREAITTVLVADLIMSLDNALGVAAIANGQIVFLAVGLLVSMVILLIGGGLVASLIDRLWWLAYAGSAVIAWVGADMVLSDPLLGLGARLPNELATLATLLVTVAILAGAHYFHRHRPAQQRLARATAEAQAGTAES